MARCGATNDDGVACVASASSTHARHYDGQGTEWPNEDCPPLPMRRQPSESRLYGMARQLRGHDSGPIDVDVWVADACRVMRRVCVDHISVITDMVWPHLDWPGDGRVMGRVVRVAMLEGWMQRWRNPDGSIRAIPSDELEEVCSRDGVVIAHNKAVPVYRSLLVTANPA